MQLNQVSNESTSVTQAISLKKSNPVINALEPLQKETCQRVALSKLLQDYHAGVLHAIHPVSGAIPQIGLVRAAIFSEITIGKYPDQQGPEIPDGQKGCEGISFNAKSSPSDRWVEAIPRSYRRIKNIRDPINRKFLETSSDLLRPAHLVNETEIEHVNTKCIVSIERFIQTKTELDSLPYSEFIHAIQKENGVLEKLKEQLSELEHLLRDMLHNQFAIPKSGNDTIGWATMDLLFLGAEVRVSILSFLLSGYNALADISYQEGNMKRTNDYLSLSLKRLNEFVDIWNGMEGQTVDADAVIEILNKVKIVHLSHKRGPSSCGIL